MTSDTCLLIINAYNVLGTHKNTIAWLLTKEKRNWIKTGLFRFNTRCSERFNLMCGLYLQICYYVQSGQVQTKKVRLNEFTCINRTITKSIIKKDAISHIANIFETLHDTHYTMKRWHVWRIHNALSSLLCMKKEKYFLEMGTTEYFLAVNRMESAQRLTTILNWWVLKYDASYFTYVFYLHYSCI